MVYVVNCSYQNVNDESDESDDDNSNDQQARYDDDGQRPDGYPQLKPSVALANCTACTHTYTQQNYIEHDKCLPLPIYWVFITTYWDAYEIMRCTQDSGIHTSWDVCTISWSVEDLP